MPKKLFLGQASHYTIKEWLAHTFAIGTKKSVKNLQDFLMQKYQAKQVVLTKNGRSALAIALKSALPKNSEIIINSFTCYAVIEAVKAAGMKPVFADINKETLHFDVETLKVAFSKCPTAKALIVQNTMGIPVDIKSIENFANRHQLKIFEDLAHCTGIKYSDGREAGTVGTAAALSFGKEKSIDTITGGALIINDASISEIPAPSISPKISDVLRARFYPIFGATYRTLSHIKLERLWMSFLIKTHQVERSADSRLNPNERPPKFIAKLALKQFKKLPQNRQPIRTFKFVNDREKVIEKLRQNGFYFDGFWFETPIAPERYFKKVNFSADDCPVATEVAKTIINLPTHYKKSNLKEALNIIKEFEK